MKGKRLRSLGGTVLIMILTVMLVLIIMLMATLTVVTTASQRIYTKYEENQAYYSARSALDVFTQNLLYDKAYIAYTDSGSKKTHTYGDGETAEMKQGLALQLELYKIKTKDTDDADVPKSIQNLLQSQFTSYAGTLDGTAGKEKKDEYLNNFGVAVSGSSYESSIVYEVEFPTLTNGTGGDGSGAHNFGEMADKKKAKITVEVLSREYDMSDDVITTGPDAGMKVKDKLATFSDEDDFKTFLSTPQNYADVVKAVVNGNRKKDKMRLKITAATMIRGVEGTAVLICNSNEPPVNNSSRAITAFGGTGSDNMSILGGMSAENTITWGSNDGFIYGPVYVEEDFLMTSNGPKINLGSGENLVVGGDMQLANSGHFEVNNISADPTIVDDEKAPFVFIGGELRIISDIDNPFKNVDVIAKELNVGAKVTLDSSNTIYCSKFTSNCVSNSTYNGDIYVDGDVTIFNDNDTKVMWSGEPLAPTVVHGGSGTIHFTGKVIEGTSGTDVTSGAVTGFVHETANFWDGIPGLDAITNPLPTTTEGDDGTKIEVPLPGRSHNKQLETHVQNFDNYYEKDEDGNRVKYTVTVTKPDGTTEDQDRPVVKSAQTMADIDTMTDKTKPFTVTDTGITDLLSDKAGPGGSFYGETFHRVLDTGGGEVKCQWNVDNEKIYIKGGGTVELLLSKAAWGGGIGYSNDNLILVDDDTTLKIIGDTTSGDINFAKLEVYNQTTWGSYRSQDAGKGIDKLKVGNLTGKGIKVPKIYYYFSGNNKFVVQNNCLLTGYIYGPETEIDMHAASMAVPAQGMEYNGAAVTGAPVCIIGSALVKGAKMPNNTGVAYINPDLDDDGDKGDPIHQWQAYQYTRN